MAPVIIQSAGLLTTIQDAGRYGYQRYGMPIAGAMDVFSLQLANALVGNDSGAACLEATFTGPEIHFTGDGFIALTGADMGPTVNGIAVPVNKPLKVVRGDMLGFTGLKNGFRTYIAFAGGIDVPAVMGSRSTYLRANLGGFGGRALKAGDELPLGEITGRIKEAEIPERLIPQYQSDQAIRIISGPESGRFTMEGIHSFLTSEYKITEKSDRMGYRLSGKAIVHKEAGADIISSGISRGTVQVPGNGQPIILMADRQTSGGYTRIACVISADLTLVAQMKPGDIIHFRETSIDKAQEVLLDREKLLRDL
ncbi:MAG TPA: biotin-dependent carboxyltransferase family protein [Bacteroidales bacterium]|nr:biotin-dependent carboxyltransferase family protein [Bacteroidales bacterium]